MFFENKIGADAVFSDCRKYRYVLWRVWDLSKARLMIIGLNPSSANEKTNDNTITKVIKIAKHNGYGSIYMVNLFAIISSKPKILKPIPGVSKHQQIDLQKHNEIYLRDVFHLCHAVLFAWGNFRVAQARSIEIARRYAGALCIEQNNNGSPKHPLYCKDRSTLQIFNYKNFFDNQNNENNDSLNTGTQVRTKKLRQTQRARSNPTIHSQGT